MLFRRNMKKNKTSEVMYKEEFDNDTGMELTSANIKELLKDNCDVIIRELYINAQEDLTVTLVFIDVLVDTKVINDNILKPLTQEMSLGKAKSCEEIIDMIEHGVLYHTSQKTRDNISDCIRDIMDGSAALIFDDVKKAVTFDVKDYEIRGITEPVNENVIKGAKDSFIEDFRTNIATLRRRIKSHNLVIEEIIIGRESHSKIGIVYLKGITNQHIVEELRNRLKKIDVDGVLTMGVIEENIIDNKYSPFPQITYTERPDKFCANILEGQVGLITDGFPLGSIVPATFNQFLQAPEDYSQNFIISSLIRLLRYVNLFITLLLPGFYISITTFNHEMLPTKLALSLELAKEGVPFPTFIEVALMLIAFEILVEAGLRLPKLIGQTISIVGAVIVGQAAVEAKFVSPGVVIIIALTAIASFTMPNQDLSNSLRLWRFILVIFSSFIGLYGLSLGALLLMIHLSKMEVFNTPYLVPFVSDENKQMQDTIFRLPFSTFIKRPIHLKTTDKKRQG